MHGGLTPEIINRITKNKGIIGPLNLKVRAIYPKYVKGCLKKEKMDVVISSGISKLKYSFLDYLLLPNINKIHVKKLNKYEKRSP